MNFLESMGIVHKETDNNFKMAPAIMMMVLILVFLGTIIYLFASSLGG